MQPTDNVQFGAAVLKRLAAPLDNFFVAYRIACRVAQIAAKGTQAAAVNAYIRGVQVRIDIIIRPIAVFPPADDVGQFADEVEIDVWSVKPKPLGCRQPLAGLGLLAYRMRNRFVVFGGHLGGIHGTKQSVAATGKAMNCSK